MKTFVWIVLTLFLLGCSSQTMLINDPRVKKDGLEDRKIADQMAKAASQNGSRDYWAKADSLTAEPEKTSKGILEILFDSLLSSILDSSNTGKRAK